MIQIFSFPILIIIISMLALASCPPLKYIHMASYYYILIMFSLA